MLAAMRKRSCRRLAVIGSRISTLGTYAPACHEQPLLASAPVNVLFLSYDGMTDPLGPSQVLPYLFGLAKRGHTVRLASLEKPGRSPEEMAEVRAQCERNGIEWHPLRFRSDLPFIGVFDNYRQLWRKAVELHGRQTVNLIHARSYIPAMVGARMKRRFGTGLLFDMRGFWPDERVDGGLWPQNNPVYRLVYRYFKRRESELLREADSVISLTHAGKQILLEQHSEPPPIRVIPCCADLDAFPAITPEARTATRNALGIPQDARVVAYLGSIGTWYMLDEMMDFFACQLREQPNSVFLFVTRDDAAPIKRSAAERGIAADRLVIRPATRAEVPQLLASADYGLFFIKPCFSKRASSPTKLGEFLAMGIPVVTNSGVGDVDEIISESGAGFLVERFRDGDYRSAITQMDSLPRQPDTWRLRAKRWFDLEQGIAAYAEVYDDLAVGSRLPRR